MSKRLIVIAGETDVPRWEKGSAWVLRLAGTPRQEEPWPPDLMDIAEEAASDLRDGYPGWLWQWTTATQAFSLATFPGSVSWWWYTPISEKSCLRSRLIQELYWLTLLRKVLVSHPEIESVEWHGDDGLIAAAVQSMVAAQGRSFRSHLVGLRRWSVTRLALRRVAYTGYAVARWLLFRLLAIPGDAAADPNTDVVFFTRFPKTWDTSSPPWRERMYGNLPDFLSAKGHHVLYAASPFGPLRSLLVEHHSWRKRSRDMRVCHLEARLGLVELVRCHATLRLFVRYFLWRRKERHEPVTYDGIEITDLLWREMDGSVMSPEIPADLALSTSLTALLRSLPAVGAVFASFEYQPSERAVAVAVHSRAGAKVVGTQAGMYTSNQMGWNLYAPEIDRALDVGQRHHLPDLICAYGELPHRVFSVGMGQGCVGLVGGIRYFFDEVVTAPKPAGRVVVLVATPCVKSEAIPLIESVSTVMAGMPEAVVHFKFHPLLPLRDEVLHMAERFDSMQYRVTDEPIPDLLGDATMMICGGTSAAVESIVAGCMPLVFRPLGELAANPILHIPDAAFFWTTIDDLRGAMESCLRRDEAYERRAAAWPAAISEHLYQVDGLTNERLYDFLSEHGAFTPAGEARALHKDVAHQ
jgi:surface carbohydrate biosynthesis protein (TIGR04326 family)